MTGLKIDAGDGAGETNGGDGGGASVEGGENQSTAPKSMLTLVPKPTPWKVINCVPLGVSLCRL